MGENLPERLVDYLLVLGVQENPNLKEDGVTPINPNISCCKYTPYVVDRFPKEDHKDMPLDSMYLELLCNFCVPMNIEPVESWKPIDPILYHFVLTSTAGLHRFGTCIRFYEEGPPPHPTENHGTGNIRNSTANIGITGYTTTAATETKTNFLHSFSSSSSSSSSSARLSHSSSPIFMADHENQYKYRDIRPSKMFYQPKIVCLLSHWPFFKIYREFLMELYKVTTARLLPLPFAEYVQNFAARTPIPKPGQQVVLSYNGLYGLKDISYTRPPAYALPPVDPLFFWRLFSYIDIETVVSIVSAMLLECKIVLHCRSAEHLVELSECLRSFMYPIEWICVYVPLCPSFMNLADMLEAPTPIMYGVHTAQLNAIIEEHGPQCLDPIFVVDVDNSIVKYPDPNYYEYFEETGGFNMSESGYGGSAGSQRSQREEDIIESYQFPKAFRHDLIDQLKEHVPKALQAKAKAAYHHASRMVSGDEYDTDGENTQLSGDNSSISSQPPPSPAESDTTGKEEKNNAMGMGNSNHNVNIKGQDTKGQSQGHTSTWNRISGNVGVDWLSESTQKENAILEMHMLAETQKHHQHENNINADDTYYRDFSSTVSSNSTRKRQRSNPDVRDQTGSTELINALRDLVSLWTDSDTRKKTNDQTLMTEDELGKPKKFSIASVSKWANQVRCSFFEVMICMLEHYAEYLIDPHSLSSSVIMGDIFDDEKFLQRAPKQHRGFLEKMVKTQSFTYFVHRACEEGLNDPDVRLFNSSIQHFRKCRSRYEFAHPGWNSWKEPLCWDILGLDCADRVEYSFEVLSSGTPASSSSSFPKSHPSTPTASSSSVSSPLLEEKEISQASTKVENNIDGGIRKSSISLTSPPNGITKGIQTPVAVLEGNSDGGGVGMNLERLDYGDVDSQESTLGFTKPAYPFFYFDRALPSLNAVATASEAPQQQFSRSNRNNGGSTATSMNTSTNTLGYALRRRVIPIRSIQIESSGDKKSWSRKKESIMQRRRRTSFIDHRGPPSRLSSLRKIQTSTGISISGAHHHRRRDSTSSNGGRRKKSYHNSISSINGTISESNLESIPQGISSTEEESLGDHHLHHLGMSSESSTDHHDEKDGRTSTKKKKNSKKSRYSTSWSTVRNSVVSSPSSSTFRLFRSKRGSTKPSKKSASSKKRISSTFKFKDVVQNALMSPGMKRRGSHTSFSLKRNAFFPVKEEE
eukprot:g3509.t1